MSEILEVMDTPPYRLIQRLRGRSLTIRGLWRKSQKEINSEVLQEKIETGENLHHVPPVSEKKLPPLRPPKIFCSPQADGPPPRKI